MCQRLQWSKVLVQRHCRRLGTKRSCLIANTDPTLQLFFTSLWHTALALTKQVLVYSYKQTWSPVPDIQDHPYYEYTQPAHTHTVCPLCAETLPVADGSFSTSARRGQGRVEDPA